ncbi:MAG: hypothetical protein HY064_08090 [Bacteroidetes bacterium]|nr:hypothetical protein [Bacteroidota bacterium]
MKFRIARHLLIAFLPLLFLFSCGERNDKEITEINSLRVKLSQTDSLLLKVDKDEAEKKEAELKNNAQFIQYNINLLGDTLDFKTALFLNYYRSLLRNYQTVADSYSKILLQADSSRRSLDNLEHDLKNNTLADGLTPEKCIESETERVNYLYQHAGDLRSMLEQAKSGYDTLSPKVAGFMAGLNMKLAARNQNGH